jgi:hypothetical protein
MANGRCQPAGELSVLTGRLTPAVRQNEIQTALIPVATSAAVTTPTAATAISSAATIATAATTWWATATATSSVASTTATGPRFPGLGDIYRQRPAVVLLRVQRFDRFVGFIVDRHFDEAEAARAAGFAIHHDLGTGHRAVLGEERHEVVFRALPGQIANVKINHVSNPIETGKSRCIVERRKSRSKKIPGKTF